jgi:hypothetical protein
MTEIVTLLVGLVLGYVFRMRGDENQIRYTRLYEQRATVAEKLYKLHSNLESWTSPLQTGGEDAMERKRRVVADAFDELANHYYSNSLWLDDMSVTKMDALLAKTKRLISDYDKVPGTGYQHPLAVQHQVVSLNFCKSMVR